MPSSAIITGQYLNQSFWPRYSPLATEHYYFDQIRSDSCGKIIIWESPDPFVVLGHANPLKSEVKRLKCERDGIPIYRRISGGGTVVQGRGCLNYTYLFPVSLFPELATITSTTAFFLTATMAILEKLGVKSAINGTSDLTIDQIKFSGNAQKRSRDAVLFHGTILYDFNLQLIEDWLHFPTHQPEYRNSRDHGSFLTNIPIKPSEFYHAALKYWQAAEVTESVSHEIILDYGLQFYEKSEWNEKF